MIDNSLATIEQILNDLEDLARSTVGAEAFYSDAFRKCQAMTGASCLALAVPTAQGRWVLACRQAGISAAEEAQLLEGLIDSSKNDKLDLLLHRTVQRTWYGYPLSHSSLSKGVFVAGFNEEFPSSMHAGLQEVMKAIAEVFSERQTRLLDRMLSNEWPAIQDAARVISNSGTIEEASRAMVNALAYVIPSCRVSVHRAVASNRCSTLAISAVPKIDDRSPVVGAIRKRAEAALAEKRAVVHRADLTNVQNPKNESGEASTLFLPFGSESSSERPLAVLGFEFASNDSFAEHVVSLPYILPIITNAWTQQSRMLRIPRFARVWASTGLSSKWKSKIWKQVLYLTLFISLIVMLFRPQPLLIEAEGALMPLESKSIFATSEGFVSELLVNEDQHVQEGQVLLRLRSPSLELQQEELAGQFRTLDEEAKSLRISINQIDPTANDVLNQQSTLAAKLNDIQIQQESLQKQLTIIEGQIKGLELKSPIFGTVVGRDLRQSLQGRPVNRGDLLFKVMDLQNEWEARLQVRDRDSDYVLRWYHPNASDDDRTFQLLIDSAPQKKFESIVTAVANRVSNLHREGCFLEVHATIKDLTAEERRVGSSVRAYFNCGEEPTWFVWTRPLIEAARRKLWF